MTWSELSLDVFPELRVIVADGAVELKVIPLADLPGLAAQVASGLFPHGPTTLSGWYQPHDLVATARRVIAYQAQVLVDATPAKWDLPLGIYTGGQVVGLQTLHGVDFPERREAATGSWILPAHRGLGLGKLARAGIVAAAFAELEARWVVSSALVENPASQAVSLAAGYQEDGREVTVLGGEARELVRFRIARARWEAMVRPGVRCEGFDGWLDKVGL